MSVRMKFTALRSNAKLKPSAQLRAALEIFTYDFVQQVVETTKKYPPAFADSTYERTYRLLGAWRIKRTTSGGVQWQVTNAVQDRKTGIYYAGRVHGSAPIQPFFAGRGWLKLSDVLKAYGGRDALARGAQTIISTYVGA